MQPFSPISEFLSRVPPLVKMLVLIGAVSFVAIFAFNVAVGTVISYAIFALLCGSHLFMHGSHGSHQHQEHTASGPSSHVLSDKAPSTEEHANHSKGCH